MGFNQTKKHFISLRSRSWKRPQLYPTFFQFVNGDPREHGKLAQQIVQALRFDLLNSYQTSSRG